jgi:2-dehydro-3-deoxyphosphogluconate aldolase/(4S)-4-hydroxy-2-oxoglutarate aldolase
VRETARALVEAVIVSVVRDSEQTRAAKVVDALFSAGIRALEVTAPTPGCFDILHAHRDKKDVVLGVGTVLDRATVTRAKEAGARFIVSPSFDPDIIAAAHEVGMVAIPGAYTPTEIVNAQRAGADFIKIFPISTAGGPKYLRLLGGPLPNLPLWVSGNVALEEIGDYLDAGAKLLGLTSALSGDPRPEVIAENVKQAFAAVTLARSARTLLLIQGTGTPLELDFDSLLAMPAGEQVRVGEVVAGRSGEGVWLRTLLARAGVPQDAEVTVESADGSFRRTTGARALYEGGIIQHQSGGLPLSRDAGGPLRLYVKGGTSNCDNVKGLARIAVPE